MATAPMSGELSIILTYDAPAKDSYRQNRGDTERRTVQLFAADGVTEELAVKLAEQFRRQNAELNGKISIQWTGPRTL